MLANQGGMFQAIAENMLVRSRNSQAENAHLQSALQMYAGGGAGGVAAFPPNGLHVAQRQPELQDPQQERAPEHHEEEEGPQEQQQEWDKALIGFPITVDTMEELWNLWSKDRVIDGVTYPPIRVMEENQVNYPLFVAWKREKKANYSRRKNLLDILSARHQKHNENNSHPVAPIEMARMMDRERVANLPERACGLKAYREWLKKNQTT